jgi:hypothetical protein
MPPSAHCKIKSSEKRTSSSWLAKGWIDCSTDEKVAGRKANKSMKDDQSYSLRSKRLSLLIKRSLWLWKSIADNTQRSR